MKTGGASGNGNDRTPGAWKRPGVFRVDLAGGLHRHVKKTSNSFVADRMPTDKNPGPVVHCTYCIALGCRTKTGSPYAIFVNITVGFQIHNVIIMPPGIPRMLESGHRGRL